MAGKEEADHKFYCGVDGCEYGANRQGHIKDHKANKHDIGVVWKVCKVEGCGKRFKQTGHLTKHMKGFHKEGDKISCEFADCDYETTDDRAMIGHKLHSHNVGVKWYCCDFKNCKERFKTQQNLNRHKLKHIDKRDFKCDVKDCSKDFKSQQELKHHKDRVHGKKKKTAYCDIKDCDRDEPFLTQADLKSHKLYAHGIGKKNLRKCDQHDCEYQYTKPSELKKHKADKHNIDIEWKYCDVGNCEHKTKQDSNMRTHQQRVHKIGMDKIPCDVENCDYTCAANHMLKRHKETVHDIGKHDCDFCKAGRNSKNPYKDAQGKHSICNACYKTTTGKNTRIEHIVSDYLDEHVGVEYLLGSDDSLKKLGGCQMYRPDKLYTSDDLVIIVEVDEHQHSKTNGDYTCDEKRISDIYDEFAGKTMVVIRWNPHAYKPSSGKKKVPLADRKTALVKTFNDLRLKQHEDPIHIYYMYYDEDNPRIAKNIPHTLMY